MLGKAFWAKPSHVRLAAQLAATFTNIRRSYCWPNCRCLAYFGNFRISVIVRKILTAWQLLHVMQMTLQYYPLLHMTVQRHLLKAIVCYGIIVYPRLSRPLDLLTYYSWLFWFRKYFFIVFFMYESSLFLSQYGLLWWHAIYSCTINTL